MQRRIPRLDLMIAYSCNISCRGCISLSDIKRNGVEPLDNIVGSVSKWSEVLAPDVVTIFGGEPLLHPKIVDILHHVRKSWAQATIRVITNGLLLDKIPADIWYSIDNIEIQISVHREEYEAQINQSIKRIAALRTGWKPKVYTSDRDHRQFEISIPGIKIWKSKFRDFVVPYRKIKGEIKPHKSNPAQAHMQCGSPDSPVLYRDKLYKCPPVANLIDIQGSWVGYTGLTVDADLTNFVNNINRPEAVCAACPDNPNYKYNHFNPKNVQPRNLS